MIYNKTAIVTGCTGQDGSYLSEFLLEQDYRVIGVARRSMRDNNYLVECLDNPNFELYIMDITDSSGVRNLVRDIQPDEFYNLAAMSHVGQSFKEPLSTVSIDGLAVVGILEAIRHECASCKLYQASSSEVFGTQVNVDKDGKCYQNENTPMIPRSPYGAAKLLAHNTIRIYREAYGLFVCAGILHNHESMRRGKDFVTRKITDGIARIKYGLQTTIKLGNLEPYRDFGYAPDYVQAMHMMLQQDSPDDFVIATGDATSIREILQIACDLTNLCFEDVYEVDERFMRPAEIMYLRGDASKANTVLGWQPNTPLKVWLGDMVAYDMYLVSKDLESKSTSV